MTEQRVGIGNEQERPLPLMEALGIAIAEFELQPSERLRDEYPYMVAYFRGEKSLVMLQKSRPIGNVFYSTESHHDGYFAEVFDIGEDGRAQNGVSDPSVLNGVFRRVEVTDEDDDPYHKIGLTPTRFPDITREFFGKIFQRQQQALPGTVDEGNGTLGQLFTQQQIREAGQSQSEQQRRSLRETIIKRYFREKGQGFSKKVGNEHFVITEDEESSLVLASKALGITTHVVKPSEDDLKLDEPVKLETLKDSRGLLPMIISAEGQGLDNQLNYSVGISASLYAAKLPLFVFIDLDREADKRGGSTYRSSPGWYRVRGEDPELIKRLLMKVGVDYLLTSRVREIAGGLS